MADDYAPEMQDPGDGDMLGALADVVCEHAGHVWVDAGGGVDICGVCEATRDRTSTFPWQMRGTLGGVTSVNARERYGSGICVRGTCIEPCGEDGGCIR